MPVRKRNHACSSFAAAPPSIFFLLRCCVVVHTDFCLSGLSDKPNPGLPLVPTTTLLTPPLRPPSSCVYHPLPSPSDNSTRIPFRLLTPLFSPPRHHSSRSSSPWKIGSRGRFQLPPAPCCPRYFLYRPSLIDHHTRSLLPVVGSWPRLLGSNKRYVSFN